MVAFSGALVLTTILQGQAARESIAISRDVFNAANRPYVGVVSIDTSHVGRNAEGSPLASGMRFRVAIKNVGTVPALNYRATWRVFLDGVEQKGEEIPATATTLFPGVIAYLAGDIGGISYGPLIKEEIALELQTTVYYEWPGGHHTECYRDRYNASLDSFLNLGACTIE